jgi:CDP-diacylglycerol--serine O-phosphatidyltransferase
MTIKKYIPNIITCGNLFCGCVAIVNAFDSNLIFAAYLVGIAAVLDFLDGFAARLLKVHSEIGKQLDSLADMVTFGLVPGIILFLMLSKNIGALPHELIYIAFLIPIFSALRLAKFNVDTRQSDSFIGVPTPASSILVGSLPLIVQFQPQIGNFAIAEFIQNPTFLISLTVILSYLMVAELPLFALKFKNFSWGDNQLRFGFLIISALLLILFKFIAIPFIIFLYVLLSILNLKNTKL